MSKWIIILLFLSGCSYNTTLVVSDFVSCPMGWKYYPKLKACCNNEKHLVSLDEPDILAIFGFEGGACLKPYVLIDRQLPAPPEVEDENNQS